MALEEALERSQVALLLVTPDYLASDTIARHELPRLLERARQGRLKVQWVPVVPSYYQASPLAGLPPAHDPALPLAGLREAEVDQALLTVSEQVIRLFKGLPPPPEPISSVLKRPLFLATLAAFLAQAGCTGWSLREQADSLMIYTSGFLFCAGMGWLAFLHRGQGHDHPGSMGRSVLHRRAVILCLVLAALAPVPGAYRWVRVNTTWHFPWEEMEPPLLPSWRSLWSHPAFAADAAPALPAPDIQMYLDPLRSSLRCVTPRTPGVQPAGMTDIVDCGAYDIPGSLKDQLLHGWERVDRQAARVAFEQKYRQRVLLPAFEALQIVHEGRAIPELTEENIVRFVMNRDWKEKLLRERLLPDLEGWKRLEARAPEKYQALLTYLSELLGLPAPFCRVTIRNHSDKPIAVDRIRYSAKFGTVARGDALTGYLIPRYLLELEPGIHTEELRPAVEVPAGGSSRFDLKLSLREPRPGQTVHLQLTFMVRERRLLFPERQAVTMPAFTLTFWGGREGHLQ